MTPRTTSVEANALDGDLKPVNARKRQRTPSQASPGASGLVPAGWLAEQLGRAAFEF
jgi:hypothetical protein